MRLVATLLPLSSSIASLVWQPRNRNRAVSQWCRIIGIRYLPWPRATGRSSPRKRYVHRQFSPCLALGDRQFPEFTPSATPVRGQDPPHRRPGASQEPVRIPGAATAFRQVPVDLHAGGAVQGRTRVVRPYLDPWPRLALGTACGAATGHDGKTDGRPGNVPAQPDGPALWRAGARNARRRLERVRTAGSHDQAPGSRAQGGRADRRVRCAHPSASGASGSVAGHSGYAAPVLRRAQRLRGGFAFYVPDGRHALRAHQRLFRPQQSDRRLVRTRLQRPARLHGGRSGSVPGSLPGGYGPRAPDER